MQPRSNFTHRWAAAAAVLAIAALAGCATQPQPQPQPAPPANQGAPAPQVKRGGIIKYAHTGDAPGLDPYLTLAFRSQQLASLAYDRLLTFPSGEGTDPDDLTPVPSLAESWNQESPTSYLFKIRQGVKWQNVAPLNGRALDSSDVKFSYEHLVDPKTNSPNAYLLDVIDKIDTPDKYTVRITTKKPYAPFITHVASHFAWIIPRELIERDGNLNKTMIGTGPFIFEEFEKGNKVVFKRNPDYFTTERPYLDGVQVLVIPDESQRVAGLRTGQLDMGYQIDIKTAKSLQQSKPDLVLQKFCCGAPGWGMMGVTHPPLDKVEVRQAISLAMDRQAIIDSQLDGEALLYGVIPPTLPQWTLPQDELKALYKPNLEKARDLLAKAGLGNGFKTEILTTATYGPLIVNVAQIIAQDLKKIGVDAEIKQVEYAGFLKAWADHSFQLAYGLGQFAFDPDGYTTGPFRTGSSRNNVGISDKALDARLDEQQTIMDLPKRKAFIQSLERDLLQQNYEFYIYSPYQFEPRQSWVKGWSAHATSAWPQMALTWLAK